MGEDRAEFIKLYNEFRPKILRYMRRMVGDYAAEDLTQDVFIKVRDALNSFRGESQISTWVYRIATNAALDRLRSSSFKQSIQSESLPSGETDTDNKATRTHIKSHSPEAALIRTEMNDCIRNFIEQLPTDYRAAFVLSEFDELKNSQIEISLGSLLIQLKSDYIVPGSSLRRNWNPIAVSIVTKGTNWRVI